MELPCEDENHLYVDEKVFLSRLSDMQRCPVPEENGIYRISGKTERWVRITLSLRHGHSLVMLDLDGLKSVNDTYGHESGDIYIRETAVCMKGIPEDHAIVGRRSGDEFFILLFGYEDRNGVRKQLRDFYDILDKHPAVLPDGIQLKIQISSGIAWYGGELCTFEELVRCADIALYEAKSTMKGQTVEYSKG